MSSFVQFSQIGKTYPSTKGPAVIVQDFNLEITKGEFVCLIGHSGCGKSTVLSMIAGLNGITDGGIILGGKELAGPGPDRGVVFQSPSLLPWYTAFENVRASQVLAQAAPLPEVHSGDLTLSGGKAEFEVAQAIMRSRIRSQPDRLGGYMGLDVSEDR